MKIRKAIEEDVDGIANVHINSWKTTYKGILPDQYLS
ncbi:GNAT family N-acetyltransferase, partial [Peribacillus frigoritolerans]